MRTLLIIVAAPLLDDDLGLAERAEDFTVEQLIPYPGVEALDVSVLPGAAGRDVGRACAHCSDPFLNGFSNELRTIV